ncbi:MAG: flagellar hook assembly protein FlgD [Bacillota bacterium]
MAKKKLDQSDFLNLLVAQLKNQDPLDPQSNEEFMSTMAQFNSLEALVSLEKSVQYSQAAAIINKPVTVQLPNKEPVAGMVEKAGLVDGKVVIYVGGKEYSLSDVKEIQFQDPEGGAATGSDLIQAAAMIGREVLIIEGDTRLRGIVERVGLAGGAIQVYVNGTPYDISGIAEIGETGPEAPAGDAASVPQDGV